MKESTDYNNRAQVELVGIQSLKPPKPYLDCKADTVLIGEKTTINGNILNKNSFNVVCNYVLKANGTTIKSGSGLIEPGKRLDVSGKWTVPDTYEPGDKVLFTLYAENTSAAEEAVPPKFINGNQPNPDYQAFKNTYQYDETAKAWYEKNGEWKNATTECLKIAVPTPKAPVDYELTPSIIVNTFWKDTTTLPASVSSYSWLV